MMNKLYHLSPLTAAMAPIAGLLVIGSLLISAPASGQQPGQRTGEQAGQRAGQPTSQQAGPVVVTRADAISRVLERNYGLQIARTRLDIARRDVTYGNAGFLPVLSANASQSHVFGGTGLFGGDDIRTQTQFGLQLDWLVFGGFGRFSTYRRLEDVREAQTLQTQSDVESTLVEVSAVYWDVVRQRRILEALAETRTISQERVAIAKARLDAGTGSQVDVNLAKVELNQDRSSVAEQNIAIASARARLNQTLADPADRTIRIDPSLEPLQELDYERLKDDALAKNRRVQVARAEQNVAAEQVEEARSLLWPSLSVSLAYNYAEYHQDIAPNFDAEPGLEYGIALSVPIFDGFNRYRRIDNAESRRLIAQTTIDEETSVVVAELRTQWEAYQRQAERIELAEESVELARANVEVALVSLEAGTISQFDLRQVQLNFLDAQIRMIDASVAAKQAEVRLLALAGRLYGEWVE
jgi:outer membrane protein TolC